ncbi:MAG: hypothetical protein K2X03_18480 [Bryobacteraceae bacterium]|nr:hypothetical protein [Bryobacteraceae bacterium]
MKSIRRVLLAFTLAMAVGAGQAQEFGPDRALVGTWYLFITIDGAPPCQCIQIDTFRADGTLEGPASDRLSGEQRGVWARTADGRYTYTILQNNINADGTPGGLYVIKTSMTLTGADAATGKFTFQVLSNGGTVQFSGTGSLTAKRIRP